MAAITVDRESNKTIILRRQNGVTWLFCIPHLALLCFEVAVPVVAIYTLFDDLVAHRTVPNWILPAGILFGIKAAWFGQLLYKILAAKSVLIVQGDTLQVITGQAGRMTDYGTYSASALSDLTFQSGKNLVLPGGKVTALVGDVPITLADRIGDADGSHLIDFLCDAYPFSTSAPAPSPVVTSWS